MLSPAEVDTRTMAPTEEQLLSGKLTNYYITLGEEGTYKLISAHQHVKWGAIYDAEEKKTARANTSMLIF